MIDMIEKFLNFFKKKKKSEIEIVGDSSNVMIFEGTTTWEVSRRVKEDNHLLIVNGVVQAPKINYNWVNDCFTFDCEVRDGDILRVFWL